MFFVIYGFSSFAEGIVAKDPSIWSVLSLVMGEYKGLSTFKKYHFEAAGLHEFFIIQV